MKKIKGPKFFKLLAGALGITPAVCTLASCDLLQPETGFITGYASVNFSFFRQKCGEDTVGEAEDAENPDK